MNSIRFLIFLVILVCEVKVISSQDEGSGSSGLSTETSDKITDIHESTEGSGNIETEGDYSSGTEPEENDNIETVGDSGRANNNENVISGSTRNPNYDTVEVEDSSTTSPKNDATEVVDNESESISTTSEKTESPVDYVTENDKKYSSTPAYGDENYGTTKGSDNPGGDTEPSKKSIDYALLDLNENLLRGSRWAVEQKKKSRKIEVYNALEIVDISKVDVDTMSLRVELHFRQRWSADDLKLPEGLFFPNDTADTFIRASPNILDSIWSPDSYIPMSRENKIASLTTSQSVVNIFKNKTIVYKARMYTVLGCAFNFQWYPLDKQTCDLTIESYTLSTDMVSYLWETTQEPVHLADLKLLQYDLHVPLDYSNGSAERWGRNEKYPYVKLVFSFERQLGHHIIQVFIPTTLVVILSWFSFWLGLDAIPGRISLLITCMLTLVTMHSGLKGSIPPVNYIKMMDIWMVGCMIIVFLALCEFVIVKYLHWRKQQELKAAEEMEKEMKEYTQQMKVKHDKVDILNNKSNSNNIQTNNSFNPYIEFYRTLNNENVSNKKHEIHQRVRHRNPVQAWEVPNYSSNHPMMMTFQQEYFHPIQPTMKNKWDGYPPNMKPPQKRPIWVIIDRLSRFVFPFSFLLFNTVYWPVLLIGASRQ